MLYAIMYLFFRIFLGKYYIDSIDVIMQAST